MEKKRKVVEMGFCSEPSLPSCLLLSPPTYLFFNHPIILDQPFFCFLVSGNSARA